MSKARKILSAVLALAAVGAVGTALAQAGVTQKDDIRVKVSAKLAPKRLPRHGTMPISVLFAGHISSTQVGEPPRLKSLKIDINRYGQLDTQGLRSCDLNEIRFASNIRALAACRSSLVGQGRFWADIYLTGQEAVPTVGRLLIFNGHSKGRPVLFGHIYSPRPFATSFVIPFKIRQDRDGRYGTELTAAFPKSMGSWGNVTGIEMKLARRYSFRGRRHSFLSAGCPAPKGFPGTAFTLTRTRFAFTGGETISSSQTGNCTASGK